jgi:hypothetical protein
MTKVQSKRSKPILGPIRKARVSSTFRQTSQVPSTQLVITAEATARMKELIREYEVRYFPEDVSPEERHVLVESLQAGLFRVVVSDENLLRFLRWMSPIGLASRKIPVCLVTDGKG